MGQGGKAIYRERNVHQSEETNEGRCWDWIVIY